MVSEKFGRYAIKAEIGRGGMATVYRAYDPHFEREVALKVLPAQLLHDPTFQTRFTREARIIATLEHAGIVPVYDYGEECGQPYYVMRLMGGGSLADVLEHGPIAPAEAARIVDHIADALDEAHSHGIIHRDLKPANILFDTRKNPYISDFGIAKLVQASTPITASNVVIGTPAYMSPEQGRGERDVDARSDIYALGALLFQMLSGRVPYESETPTGQIIKHITEPIPDVLLLRPDLPPGLQTVIARAMAKDREERYHSVAEMADALNRAVKGEPVTPYPRVIAAGDTQVEEKPSNLPHQAVAAATIDSQARAGSQPAHPIPVKPTSRPATPKPVSPERRMKIWGWLMIGFTLLVLLGLILLGLRILPRINRARLLAATGSAVASVKTNILPTPSPPPSNTPTPQPPAAQRVASKAIAEFDAMPVRNGPGLIYFVVDTYPRGTEFEVIARDQNEQWLAVLLPMSGNTGWVRLENVLFEGNLSALPVISVLPPPTETVQATSTPGAIVAEDAARLRTGPGLNYDILAVLAGGTELVVNGRSPDAKWLFVYIQDKQMIGWIAVSTLAFDFDLDSIVVVEPPPSPTPRPDLPTETARPKKTTPVYP